MYSQLTNKTQAVFFFYMRVIYAVTFFLLVGTQGFWKGSSLPFVKNGVPEEWSDGKALFDGREFIFRSIKSKNSLITAAKYAAIAPATMGAPAAVAVEALKTPLAAGAAALGAAVWGKTGALPETEYKYSFRLYANNRVLVKLTPVKTHWLEKTIKLGYKQPAQYASLKMVSVPDRSPFKGTKRVKFVLKSLGNFRVCDRWIFYDENNVHDIKTIMGQFWDLMKEDDVNEPKVNLKDPSPEVKGGLFKSWFNRSGGARLFGKHKSNCIRMKTDGSETESKITRYQYLNYFENLELNLSDVDREDLINQYESTIEEQEKEMDAQVAQISEQNKTITEQTTQITKLQAEIEQLQKTCRKQARTIKRLKKLNKAVA